MYFVTVEYDINCDVVICDIKWHCLFMNSETVIVLSYSAYAFNGSFLYVLICHLFI